WPTWSSPTCPDASPRHCWSWPRSSARKARTDCTSTTTSLRRNSPNWSVPLGRRSTRPSPSSRCVVGCASRPRRSCCWTSSGCADAPADANVDRPGPHPASVVAGRSGLHVFGEFPQQEQIPQLSTYRGPSGEPELFGDLGVDPVDDLVDLGRTRFHCVPNLGQSVLPVVDVVLDRLLRRVQDRPVPGQKGLHPVLVDEFPQPIQRFHVGTKTVVTVDHGR